jgi:hypothetical protein
MQIEEWEEREMQAREKSSWRRRRNRDSRWFVELLHFP